MIYIKELGELKVLLGVLYNLKYKYDDDEVSKLVRSPYFSSLFEKTLLELIEGYKQLNIFDESLANKWKIDSDKDELVKIKKYLMDIENWAELNEEIRHEMVKILLSPFSYHSQLIMDIVNEINFRKGC